VSTESAAYEVLRNAWLLDRELGGSEDGWRSLDGIRSLVSIDLRRRPANSTLLAALGRLKRSGRIEQRIDDGPGRTAWWRWVGR
jgi:hypothetical protein